MAPGALAEGEDEGVDGAHGSYADDVEHEQPVDWLGGVFVLVCHAVIDKGKQPYEQVDYRVNEHEAELAVDAGPSLIQLAPQVLRRSIRMRRCISVRLGFASAVRHTVSLLHVGCIGCIGGIVCL